MQKVVRILVVFLGAFALAGINAQLWMSGITSPAFAQIMVFAIIIGAVVFGVQWCRGRIVLPKGMRGGAVPLIVLYLALAAAIFLRNQVG